MHFISLFAESYLWSLRDLKYGIIKVRNIAQIGSTSILLRDFLFLVYNVYISWRLLWFSSFFKNSWFCRLRYLNGKQELSSGTSIILVIHVSKQNLKGENKIEEAKSEEPYLPNKIHLLFVNIRTKLCILRYSIIICGDFINVTQ